MNSHKEMMLALLDGKTLIDLNEAGWLVPVNVLDNYKMYKVLESEPRTTDMTKVEAITAMHNGEKVTHEYFSPEEWIAIDGYSFIFEDGASCEFEDFWIGRDEKFWDTDWSIFKDE